MLHDDRVDLSSVRDVPLYAGVAAESPGLRPLTDLTLLNKAKLSSGFPRMWQTEALRAAIAEDQVEYTTTSGTSGDRLHVVRRRGWWREEYRRTYRHHPVLATFDFAVDRKAVLTTSVCSSAVCWRSHPTYEQRILDGTLFLNTNPDPNDWSPDDVAAIVAEIDRWRPRYLDLHATYGAVLARKAAQFGVAPPRHAPDVITSSYDFAPAAAKAACGAFFGAPPAELYGATEFGYVFVEVDGVLRCAGDLSHVEFLPLEGRDDVGRLVISTSKNQFMPLLRYDTGDLFERTGGRPSAVAGRLKDVTRADDGRPVTALDVDRAVGSGPGAPDQYRLRVGPDRLRFDHVGSCDGDRIGIALGRLYGRGRPLILRPVGQIGPESSGKFRTVGPS